MPKYAAEIILSFLLLTIAIDSATCRIIEKRDAKPDYFQNYVNQVDEVKKMPFVGPMIAPYVEMGQGLIESVDQMSGGSLHSAVNSIMPCTFVGGVKCEGTLDKDSARKLAKSVLANIPKNMLPPSIGGMLQLANDMI